MQRTARRPGTATATAVLLFIQAALSAISGLLGLLIVATFGLLAAAAGTWTADATAMSALLCLYAVGTPIGGLVLGIGLLRMRRWARKATLAFEGLQLALLAGLVPLLLASSTTQSPSATTFVVPALLPLVICGLLLAEPLRQRFSTRGSSA